jgi:hypothetical protein
LSDSRRGHRCGRARTAPVTTAAYPSDLTDDEWGLVEPLIPPDKTELDENSRAKLFFLPKYSPEPDPIEQVFKLKHLTKKAAARTVDTVCAAIGEALPAFSESVFSLGSQASGNILP